MLTSRYPTRSNKPSFGLQYSRVIFPTAGANSSGILLPANPATGPNQYSPRTHLRRGRSKNRMMKTSGNQERSRGVSRSPIMPTSNQVPRPPPPVPNLFSLPSPVVGPNGSYLPAFGEILNDDTIKITAVTPKLVIPHQILRVTLKFDRMMEPSVERLSIYLSLCGPVVPVPRSHIIGINRTARSGDEDGSQGSDTISKQTRYFDLSFRVPEIYLPCPEKLYKFRIVEKSLRPEDLRNPKFYRPCSIFPSLIVQFLQLPSPPFNSLYSVGRSPPQPIRHMNVRKQGAFRYLLPQYSPRFHANIVYKSIEFRVFSIGPTKGNVGDVVCIYFSLGCPFILPTNSVFHVQFGHTLLSKKGEIVGVYYAQKMNEYRMKAPKNAEYVIVCRVPPQPKNVQKNLLRYRNYGKQQQPSNNNNANTSPLQQPQNYDPRKVKIKVTLMSCPSFGVLPGHFEYLSNPSDMRLRRESILEFPRFMNYMDYTLGSFFFQNFLIECGFPSTLGVRAFNFLKVPIARIRHVCSKYMGFLDPPVNNNNNNNSNNNNGESEGEEMKKNGKFRNVKTDILGCSIFSHCVSRSMTYMVKIILDLCGEHRFNPFLLTDHLGNSALHYLSLYGHTEIQSLLNFESKYVDLVKGSSEIKNRIRKTSEDIRTKFGKHQFFDFRVQIPSNEDCTMNAKIRRDMYSLSLKWNRDGFHDETNLYNQSSNFESWRFQDDDDDEDLNDEEVMVMMMIAEQNKAKKKKKKKIVEEKKKKKNAMVDEEEEEEEEVEIKKEEDVMKDENEKEETEIDENNEMVDE